MLNVVSLQGRLVRDPELKNTQSGTPYSSFTIAVDRGYVKHGEERKADFIDIVAWRGTAEFVSKWFKKGSMIVLSGSVQTRNYEDKNGNKRKAVEIIANEVSFGGDKKSSNTADATADSNEFTPIDENSEDLPF